VASAKGLTDRGSRSHDAVIRVYDDEGNVIETHKNMPWPPRSGNRNEPIAAGAARALAQPDP
jgi:hypothetical protein